MKSKTFLSAALALFLMATSAQAMHHGEGDKSEKGKHHKHAKFKEFDKDGDKKFSKSEYLDMKSKHFEKLDVDGDGYLTREEMKSARKKAKERYKKMREKRQD